MKLFFTLLLLLPLVAFSQVTLTESQARAAALELVEYDYLKSEVPRLERRLTLQAGRISDLSRALDMQQQAWVICEAQRESQGRVLADREAQLKEQTRLRKRNGHQRNFAIVGLVVVIGLVVAR